jgi:hypothetical protein
MSLSAKKNHSCTLGYIFIENPRPLLRRQGVVLGCSGSLKALLWAR